MEVWVHILRNFCQVAIDCGSYEVYMDINLYKIPAIYQQDVSFGGKRCEVSCVSKVHISTVNLLVCSRPFVCLGIECCMLGTLMSVHIACFQSRAVVADPGTSFCIFVYSLHRYIEGKDCRRRAIALVSRWTGPAS